MITRVTITGADDAVNPFDLVFLSAKFPFVEWGILFSTKRKGTPRYPSDAWLLSLYNVSFGPGFALSAHLCGQIARDAMAGEDVFAILPNFQRVQINGYLCGEHHKMFRTAVPYPHEIILQVRSEDQLQHAADDAILRPVPSVSALFDPSGGRGIAWQGTLADRWPKPPTGLRLGYAGGIGPQNIEETIRTINERKYEGSFAEFLPSHAPWIDMESSVRQFDRFDLGLVEDVLTRAAKWIMPHTSC